MLSGSTPFSKPAAGIQPALSAIVDYAVYARHRVHLRLPDVQHRRAG
jgi:hypothetical protein